MTSEAIQKLFSNLALRFAQEKDYLAELDAVLGDGDHGGSMAKGFQKAYEAIGADRTADIGYLFQTAGRAFMTAIGGASGPLFAMLLLELGKASLGQTALTLSMFQEGVAGAAAAVQRLGKAQAGDKTMLDVLLPVSEALSEVGSLTEALELAAQVAQDSASKTADMMAKKGRAQYVQGAGLGHLDPGATSLALFFQTLYQSTKGSA